MRVPLLALLLVAPLAAGCLAQEPAATLEAPPLPAVTLPKVPAGAVLETLEDGYRLVWADVELPLREEIEIPAGTVLVRASGVVGEGQAVGVGLRHAETGRFRCAAPRVVAWGQPTLGAMDCIGLAAVDPLPATWVASFSSPPGMFESEPRKGTLHVEFRATPLDGPAARLDLSRLSMPAFEMLEREIAQVEGSGGIALHAEVFRPDAPGKVPTVLISSPYNHGDREAGFQPFGDVILDWGSRGYAVVIADVRGTGESGGCVEVWSKAEQEDQKALVDWIAAQEWSDGGVAMYGVSYDGTTAVMAAVQAPPALKAIIAVAPVINAYDDWHFGGVPNVEGPASPAAYTQGGVGTTVRPDDPATTALNTANAVCDPTLAPRANDPRAVYDAFYEERNFSLRAADVTAAVMYVQGFEDPQVKSAMIPHWFNALEAPKLGLFGHWIHQHAPRADMELLALAWLDEHLKGVPMGFAQVPAVSAQSDDMSPREADSWPPLDAQTLTLHPDFGEGTLLDAPADGSRQVVVDPVGAVGLGGRATLTREIANATRVAGALAVDLKVSLAGAENAYVAAELYEVVDGKATRVTWGMFNLAHHEGHDTYAPLAPGQTVNVRLPLLPTEHTFDAGSTMTLVLRGASALDLSLTLPGRPAVLTFHGGEDGTALVLPTVENADAPSAAFAWR